MHRSRLALYAHVDRTAGTVAIVDVETGKQATLGFDKLLKLDRIEYGKKSSMTGPDAEELESIRKEYRRQTERDERISRRAAELRHDRLNRTGRQQGRNHESGSRAPSRVDGDRPIYYGDRVRIQPRADTRVAGREPYAAARRTSQSPLWLVAFLLIVLGLQCWLDIVDDDETPFAIGMHALGIMLGIGWWAGLAALSSHQPADANCYGLLGGCILFGLFAWIMDRRQKAGRRRFRGCATR